MSIVASQWAWSQSIDNARHKLLLLKLADSANDDGICWPSLRTLALHTGISKSAISRTARLLQERGLLTIEETLKRDGSRGANRYVLHLGGVPSRRDTSAEGGVPPIAGDVSHSGRDRTVREPSEAKSKSRTRAASAGDVVVPQYLGNRTWRVERSDPSKRASIVDLGSDPPSCDCENRHATLCRHIRAALQAEKEAGAATMRQLRMAVFDELVEAYGRPAQKQRTSYGSATNSLVEMLAGTDDFAALGVRVANEGSLEGLKEAWRSEFRRRHAALAAEWGLGKVTMSAFVTNWGVAGKLARGETEVHDGGSADDFEVYGFN